MPCYCIQLLFLMLGTSLVGGFVCENDNRCFLCRNRHGKVSRFFKFVLVNRGSCMSLDECASCVVFIMKGFDAKPVALHGLIWCCDISCKHFHANSFLQCCWLYGSLQCCWRQSFRWCSKANFLCAWKLTDVQCCLSILGLREYNYL